MTAADADHRIDVHQRVQGQAHTGNGSELLQIRAGNGSYVHFAFDVGRAAVIDELQASVWIKADRPGLQLLGRVVLPRTIDPRTGRPATLLVQGSIYEQRGGWQQLRLQRIRREIGREAQLLRTQIPNVDDREAYVDQLVLNLYGGQGTTRVWIDDLEMHGFVGQRPGGETPRWEQPIAGAQRRVTRNGAQVLVDGRAVFPRAIRYQGERLEFLKGLGFNVIETARRPRPELLEEARRLDMWIICPPVVPGITEAGAALSPKFGPEWDAVIAWNLGDGLSSEQFEATRELARRVGIADSRSQRPLLCDALNDVHAFSRQVNVMRPFRLPLGSSLELWDYAIWLRERPGLARHGTPIWTAVQTQPHAALAEQLKLLAPGEPAPQCVAAEQVRLLVHLALAGGVRGIRFESSSSLEADDPQTRYRAQTLELVNLYLKLIEPWIVASGAPAYVSSNRDGAAAAVISLDGARLLLPLFHVPHGQFAAGQCAARSVSIVVPGVPDDYEAFLITPAGLRRTPRSRPAGGVRIALEEFDLNTLVLLTQDPRTISALARRAGQLGRRITELQYNLALERLAVARRLEARLTAVRIPQTSRWLGSAQSQLAAAQAAISAGNLEQGSLLAARAVRPIATAEQAHWQQAANALVSPLASPLTANVETLPQHWNFVRRLKTSRLGANLLPGGDCENLQRMLEAGWVNFRHPQAGVAAEADLVEGKPHSGRASLRLRAWPERPESPPTLVESPPLWITTAPVQVQAGQLMRIHGWCRIPAPLTGSVDGLMIIESLGGPALMERIGATRDWQEFTLFRAAPRTGEMTVTFALSGIGEARLDDVTIAPVDQGTDSPSVPAPAGPIAGR